jgi:hypothetical protein
VTMFGFPCSILQVTCSLVVSGTATIEGFSAGDQGVPNELAST